MLSSFMGAGQFNGSSLPQFYKLNRKYYTGYNGIDLNSSQNNDSIYGAINPEGSITHLINSVYYVSDNPSLQYSVDFYNSQGFWLGFASYDSLGSMDGSGYFRKFGQVRINPESGEYTITPIDMFN